MNKSKYETMAAILLLISVIASSAAAFGCHWILGSLTIAAWALGLAVAANDCRKDAERKNKP